jgi:hypothetical protein
MIRRSGSGEGPVAGSCEHGNEYSGFINGGDFLTSRMTVSFSRNLHHGVS